MRGEARRGGRRLHPRLGEGWADLAGFLRAAPPASLAEVVTDEYTRLFVGPHPELNLYESYYLTGRVYDRPLATLRDFLKEAGIEKAPDYAELEDFLAFELEVVRALLGRQRAAGSAEEERAAADLQGAFLARHLLVWGPAAGHDLASAPPAVFYRGVGKLVEGFLALELDLVRGWGTEEPRDLAEAREAFARVPQWRGPLLEVPESTPEGDQPGD
jgi:TorA maturation chaperone TorD